MITTCLTILHRFHNSNFYFFSNHGLFFSYFMHVIFFIIINFITLIIYAWYCMIFRIQIDHIFITYNNKLKMVSFVHYIHHQLSSLFNHFFNSKHKLIVANIGYLIIAMKSCHNPLEVANIDIFLCNYFHQLLDHDVNHLEIQKLIHVHDIVMHHVFLCLNIIIDVTNIFSNVDWCFWKLK